MPPFLIIPILSVQSWKPVIIVMQGEGGSNLCEIVKIKNASLQEQF